MTFLRLLLDETRRLWRARRGAPPLVARRPGSWHPADLAWAAALVREVSGDFAEIGVFRGDAFRVLAALARAQGRLAHAFDSFRGMAAPQPEDGEHYPQGKFDIGGPENFVRLMDEAGLAREAYRVWPGFVPECFREVAPHARFALVLIDVDHYRPTAESIAWAVPRIPRGGILALDDYVRGHTGLATRAIEEFLRRDREFERLAEFNQQLFLRRVRGA